VAAFYTNYIQQVREIGSFYTAQTRAAVQDILDPQVTDQGLVEKFLIQSILQAGFSRILAEKILHLRDADPAAVLTQETIRDHQGRHPMDAPEEED